MFSSAFVARSKPGDHLSTNQAPGVRRVGPTKPCRRPSATGEKSTLLIASSAGSTPRLDGCARQLVRFIGRQVHRLVQGVSPPAQIRPVRAGCLALVGAGTRLRLPLIDSCIAVHELNASIAQAGRNVLHAHELISCRSLGRQGVRRPHVIHGAGRLIAEFAPANFPLVGHGGNCSIQTALRTLDRTTSRDSPSLKAIVACSRNPCITAVQRRLHNFPSAQAARRRPSTR